MVNADLESQKGSGDEKEAVLYFELSDQGATYTQKSTYILCVQLNKFSHMHSSIKTTT